MAPFICSSSVEQSLSQDCVVTPVYMSNSILNLHVEFHFSILEAQEFEKAFSLGVFEVYYLLGQTTPTKLEVRGGYAKALCIASVPV